MRTVSSAATSGILRMKFRLSVAPMALRRNTSEYSHGSTRPLMTTADATSARSDPTCMKIWSRDKKRPRISSGIRLEIHGIHAAEEIPRSRLKPKRDARITASFEVLSKKTASGTAVMRKMKIVRRLQPIRTNCLYP